MPGERDRCLVVVDTETTGVLDHHVPVEIAWQCCDTGERGYFLPALFHLDWVQADPEALALNRFHERGLDQAPKDQDGREMRRLHTHLTGNAIVGFNPWFDAQKLNLMFHRYGLEPYPWDRVIDIGAHAAGALGYPIRKRLSAGKACFKLGVDRGDHSAQEDVRAAVECIVKLDALVENREVA